MNILNVCNNLDPITGGGEAERTFQMSKFLSYYGENCHVLTIDTNLSEERKSFLGKGGVIALPCLCRRFYVPKFTLSQINAIVKEADIIHLIGHWSVLNALVYLFIRKYKKSYVVCPAGSLAIYGRSKLFKELYNLIIGKKIIRNASLCIAVTPDERGSFLLYGVLQDKIRVIPNGIAEADFLVKNNNYFREKYNLGKRPFILFIGRLNVIKGPDLLLKAFFDIKNKFPDVDLVFVGPDGGMLSELKSLVKIEDAQDRIHFIGYLGGVDKSHAYHAADFIAIPSRHEAMSIVVLEAGVCGTPALLTDQCGFNQIVDEEAGWVVPATIEGLSNGLDKVLSNMGDAESAATKIKDYVLTNFSWDVIVQEYRDIYTVLINKNAY